MNSKHKIISIFLSLLLFSCDSGNTNWKVNSNEDWKTNIRSGSGFSFENGYATPAGDTCHYRSKLKTYRRKRKAKSITVKQNDDWQNWKAVGKAGPTNLGDAPVFLSRGKQDYWMFGSYEKSELWKDFVEQEAELDGYNHMLYTTPFKNQFNALGGLKKSLGGYHAWQSKDMINWVHYGPVTEAFSRWVTTAECVNGKVYIYYDYPNDQDPHLYIDSDLTDGKPGENKGLVFKDPSHGSDCAFIRDLQGRFHVIYENWDPVNARLHSWDSPLAGHAVSPNGIDSFKILPPVVDYRTTATGETEEYTHPHWKQHPDWDSDIGKYNVHEPNQDAFGDWAAISIGGRYYLFGDYHPAGKKIRLGWFTSPNIYKTFRFCGEIGQGHPDPDIGFAEGNFYLFTQLSTDYISAGPWVEKVEIRVGVDTNNHGDVDCWTNWTEIKETYERMEGFSKQIKRIPARLDLTQLPAGFGFCFEVSVKKLSGNTFVPVLDGINMSFLEYKN